MTGANRGIGQAVAEALAREPLDLLLVGARDPEAASRSPRASPAVRPTRVDLSSRESIERSTAGLPPVDLLVNNAGLFIGGLLEERDFDEVYAMFQVNLVAVPRSPARRARGRPAGLGTMVNNASIAATPGSPPPRPTPPPRLAWSRSASRCGASSRTRE